MLARCPVARAPVLCAALAATLWVAPPAVARWSAPARPPGCSAALAPLGAPLIVVPSANPHTRSGPGALLWTAPRGCRSDAGVGEVFGASLAADDLPGSSRPLEGGPAGAGDLEAVAAAVGTATGQVVVAGSGAFAEGWAPGTFGASRPLGGGPAPPVAAAGAYLGDAVLASPVRSRRGDWEIAVRVQRHYSPALGRPRLVPAGPGPVSAVAAAFDYRADILLVWAARGGVYARELPAAGAAGPVRRLGGAGVGGAGLGGAAADLEIGALISDDGHAIVAWRSQSPAPGGGTITGIELSFFQTGSAGALSPRAPTQVERFRDPPGFPPPPGSLRLIRLSSEAVMMAWTGVDASGRYVVRASPVSLRRGAWAPVTISTPGTSPGPGAAAARSSASPPPARASGSASPGGAASARSVMPATGEDAVLADLVPGPRAEALALWSAGPRLPTGGPNPRRQAILAARGHYAGHGEVAFEAPEAVAPFGPNGPPSAASDPQTGRVLAAWVTLTGAPSASRIAYALRAAGSASTPPPAGAHSATAVSPLAIALPLLALLLLAVAAPLARRVGGRRGRTHMSIHGADRPPPAIG